MHNHYHYHFRSTVLFFLPFFVVELFGFLEFFLSSGIKICCSFGINKIVNNILEKTDILFFLGKKDKTGKEKLLCLEAAKIYFGSAIQLCYQLWIFQVTEYAGGQIGIDLKRLSQYFSMISSLLLLTKSSIDQISYSRDEAQSEITEEEDGSSVAKLKKTLRRLLKTLSLYFSWFPLVLTSLLFKIGTINLFIIFYGWYSLLIIFVLFCLNLLASFIFSFVRTKNKNFLLVYNIEKIQDGTDKSMLNNFLISYSNIFVISRPVNNKNNLKS